eukprot:940464-Amphidinium_carterae.1
MMWVSGLSMMLLMMCLGFFLGWYFRKRWTEKEMTISQAMMERDHDRVKELGVKQVTITTIPESIQSQHANSDLSYSDDWRARSSASHMPTSHVIR